MKKDKKWLKEQFTYYREAVGQTFNDVSRGMNNAYDNVEKLIDQLDEPEVEQSDKKIRDLESYNDELIRDNNQLRRTIDSQESLSQEWIDENKVARIDNLRKMTTSDVVPVEKLKKLIVQKQDKPVIPKFVADWIELNKGWNEYRQEYIEDDSSGLWFALDDNSYGMPNSVSDWLFNEEQVETFARAWLDGYEVEKKKRYYIVEKINNSTLMTFELSDVVGEEIIEFVYGYSENETIHFNSKEKAELIARFVGESLEVEEAQE